MVIPGEYISSVCEVKTMQNNLVATGVIDKITEDYIEIAVKSGKMTAIHFGEEVKVNIFNSRWGFRVLVGSVYTSSMEFIRLIEVASILDYERRHFFRVDLDLKANACLLQKKKKAGGFPLQETPMPHVEGYVGDEGYYVSDEGFVGDEGMVDDNGLVHSEGFADLADNEYSGMEVSKKDEDNEERRASEMLEDEAFEVFMKSFSRNGDPPEDCELLPIKIKNLSISGLMFASNHMFENSLVWIQMKIERFSGPFPCRIKRVQEGRKKEFLYGCEFVKMPDDVANALCRYIFQRQREQINQANKLEK